MKRLPKLTCLFLICFFVPVYASQSVGVENPASQKVLSDFAGSWEQKHIIGEKLLDDSKKAGARELKELLSSINSNGGFRIHKNRIEISDKSSTQSDLKIELDFDKPGLEKFKGKQVTNGTLIVLRNEKTQIVASYNLRKDSFVLRFPAGARSRSGTVVSFKRTSK